MAPSRLWLCCLPLLVSAGWSQAQSQHRWSHPGADVFAGYSFVSPDFGYYDQSNREMGVDGGLDLHFSRVIAATVDVGALFVTYNPEENSHTVTFMAGPRFFIPLGSSAITPFADVLGGVATFNWNQGSFSPFSSSHSGALAADGGVDVRVTRHLFVRGQGGYLHTGFNANNPSLQPSVHNGHGRLLVGVVWHF